jgi:hypothetical protein
MMHSFSDYTGCFLCMTDRHTCRAEDHIYPTLTVGEQSCIKRQSVSLTLSYCNFTLAAMYVITQHTSHCLDIRRIAPWYIIAHSEIKQMSYKVKQLTEQFKKENIR